MSFLKNIKLKYTTNLLNQCIDNKNFKDFQKHYDQLKKINPKVANKYIKYNSVDFINNEELNFLFNKNIIWLNSFRKKDIDLTSNLISQIFNLSSTKKINRISFYEEVLRILEDDEIKDYKNSSDRFFKSHYYFQILVDQQNPGTKLIDTTSSFFELNKNIHFTHHKLSRCYFYIIKHPYQIFAELKKDGLGAQQALNVLCNFENRPEIVEVNKGGQNLSLPENTNSWSINASSWTNENVQVSLRGLTLYYDDLINKTEDKVIEMAAHLKESGLEMELNPLELSKIADQFKSAQIENISIELSNKEKKIIDRECGDVIEKLFSERTSF
jgi:hypothetical protein